MDCDTIKNRLSEYIDGMLEENTAQQVKDHLAQCVICRAEYNEMTRIISYMQAMESPEPSEAFLQNVNERLDKSFSFVRMIKRLFFPWQIKLPLELAGMAVVLILVVYVAGIRSNRHVYDLLFSPKAQTISDFQEKRGEKGKKGEKGEKQEKKGEPKKGEKREIDLQEIIEPLGGEIVKSEYDEENHILKSMIIEIPADKFHRLIQKLQEIGQIKEPSPSLKEKGQKTVKIRLRLQNPL